MKLLSPISMSSERGERGRERGEREEGVGERGRRREGKGRRGVRKKGVRTMRKEGGKEGRKSR